MSYIVTLDQYYFSGFYSYEYVKYAAWNRDGSGVAPKCWKTRKGAEKALSVIAQSYGEHEGKEDRMEIKEVER